MAFNVASGIETALDTHMEAAYSVLPALMDGIGLLVGTAVGLYFVMTIMSYMWTGQAAQLPVNDLFKRFFFLALVCGFAFSTPQYLKWVKEPVMEIPNDLSSLINGSAQTSASAIDKMMDDNIGLVLKIVEKLADMGLWDFSFSLLGEVILAVIVIMVLGTIYVIIAFCYLMIAKILIHVALLVGPIFIMFAFFPMTREYFTKWIGQLLNYIMLAVIFTAVFALLNKVLLGIIDTGLKPSGFFGVQTDSIVMKLFFTYLLFIGVIMAVPSLASSLTGGVGISPFGQVAQLVGGAVKGGAGLAKMMGGFGGKAAAGSIGKGLKLG